LRILIGCF